jgi:hypothetical protein
VEEADEPPRKRERDLFRILIGKIGKGLNGRVERGGGYG